MKIPKRNPYQYTENAVKSSFFTLIYLFFPLVIQEKGVNFKLNKNNIMFNYNVAAAISPALVASPVWPYKKRKTDALGSGFFGASRDGGARIHKGLDIISRPGQKVYAPISGDLTWFTYNGFLGCLITDIDLKVKVLYIKTANRSAGKVTRGQLIGTAADIRPKYGSSITNHLHLEVIINGVHVDPAKHIII